MEGEATCICTFNPRTALRERFPMFNMSRSRIAVSRYPPGLRTRLDSEMRFRYAASDIAVGNRKTTTWKLEEGKGNLEVGLVYWTCL